MADPHRYVNDEEDSARWAGVEFRDGDIVISTRSKTGTTWVQMVCALLIFQTAELPAPLSELSPWLDHLITPREEVLALLAAQRHRRFIKTHTPLDGIPLDPRARYIVTGRHPLDTAVSLHYQGDNLDPGPDRRADRGTPAGRIATAAQAAARLADGLHQRRRGGRPLPRPGCRTGAARLARLAARPGPGSWPGP
ncbi:MAG TPA: sulfotransferase domain-containing protein [Streptosporangiaceae bacterium]